MKISSRIPTIGSQESSEKEITEQQKSANSKSEIASRVDKFEGPDSIRRPATESMLDKYKASRVGRDPEPANPILDSFPDPNAFDPYHILGGGRSHHNETSGPSQRPRTNPATSNYKGPDSIAPEIESPVNKYKGPKSIAGKSVIDPRVEPSHTGFRGGNSNDAIPGTFPDPNAFDHFGVLGGGGSNQEELSEDFQKSQTKLKVDHYKGPDSLQLAEIESKVEKDKLPDSVELRTDSKP